MKNFWIAFSASILFLTACKQKKKEEPKEPFFPVMSYLHSQVANIDTSLYSIRKINILDSAHSDTVYVKREEFRGLAKEFLELPDLMAKGYDDRFTEEKLYDESMNTVIIRYVPKDPEKEDIQKEEVLIIPNNASGDQVKNIIIEKVISNKDGYLRKYFLWQVDKSFQITTTTQKPGAPELTSTMKVSWNEKDEE